MAEFATLARPYAEAVIALAKDGGTFDNWSNDLQFLAAVVQTPEFIQVINNPRVDDATLTRLLLDISEGQVSDLAKNLVRVLIDNGKIRLMSYIATEFDKLKAQHQGYIKVDILSTYDVTPEQQQALQTALQQRFGKAVQMNMRTDEALIGGWLIRAGDQVIDASVRGRLQQLGQQLHR